MIKLELYWWKSVETVEDEEAVSFANAKPQLVFFQTLCLLVKPWAALLALEDLQALHLIEILDLASICLLTRDSFPHLRKRFYYYKFSKDSNSYNSLSISAVPFGFEFFSSWFIVGGFCEIGLGYWFYCEATGWLKLLNDGVLAGLPMFPALGVLPTFLSSYWGLKELSDPGLAIDGLGKVC